MLDIRTISSISENVGVARAIITQSSSRVLIVGGPLGEILIEQLRAGIIIVGGAMKYSF
jgi:hypothetical protein